jgi:hypothetical protein
LLFPQTLDEVVPPEHVCRVIDAFVDGLDLLRLGFDRAAAADTGRPPYEPADLLKLCVYGYLHQVRSSRRLEAERRRNVEVMWLPQDAQFDNALPEGDRVSGSGPIKGEPEQCGPSWQLRHGPPLSRGGGER